MQNLQDLSVALMYNGKCILQEKERTALLISSGLKAHPSLMEPEDNGFFIRIHRLPLHFFRLTGQKPIPLVQ